MISAAHFLTFFAKLHVSDVVTQKGTRSATPWNSSQLQRTRAPVQHTYTRSCIVVKLCESSILQIEYSAGYSTDSAAVG